MRLKFLGFLVVLIAVSTTQAVRAAPPMTDAQKISDALRAGPPSITKNATILDWPSSPSGDYRILRKGSGVWACLPGSPRLPHDEPGCYDRVFLQFMTDELTGRTPHVDKVGIAYMYQGAWVANASPGRGDEDYRVGPHIMILPISQSELRGYSRDGTTGMPYLNHFPPGSDEFLVIPIRLWSDMGTP
jgi:hypothetical protein